MRGRATSRYNVTAPSPARTVCPPSTHGVTRRPRQGLSGGRNPTLHVDATLTAGEVEKQPRARALLCPPRPGLSAHSCPPHGVNDDGSGCRRDPSPRSGLSASLAVSTFRRADAFSPGHPQPAGPASHEALGRSRLRSGCKLRGPSGSQDQPWRQRSRIAQCRRGAGPRQGSQTLPALGEHRRKWGLAGRAGPSRAWAPGGRHESVTLQLGAPGALARLTSWIVRKAEP